MPLHIPKLNMTPPLLNASEKVSPARDAACSNGFSGRRKIEARPGRKELVLVYTIEIWPIILML
jgi:hypothetical protein